MLEYYNAWLDEYRDGDIIHVEGHGYFYWDKGALGKINSTPKKHKPKQVKPYYRQFEKKTRGA